MMLRGIKKITSKLAMSANVQGILQVCPRELFPTLERIDLIGVISARLLKNVL
jgi:hypothetical protein